MTYPPNHSLLLNQLKIPNRKEFHKEYAGYITIEDFSTTTPSKSRIENQRKALIFNETLRRG